MFKIGDFSRLASVSVRMLRHYDKIKLLTPAVIDDFTGYRYYAAFQLNQVSKIKKLKEMGFSLAIIKELVTIEEDPRQVENYFKIRESELQEELSQLTKQKSLLEGSLKLIREDEIKMAYHVDKKLIPARQVVSVRGILANYNQEGQLWEVAGKALQQLRIKPANPSYGMAIFHDLEYKEIDIDVEIQMAIEGGIDMELSKEISADVEVTIKQAPAVTVAAVMMNGSYEQLPAVSEAVAEWLEVSNEKLKGAMFNIYHVSPGQDPNPANWVTEVCYPLKESN